MLGTSVCSFCYCFEHGKRNSTTILCLCPKRIISRLKGICQLFAGMPVLSHRACPCAKGSITLIVPAEWQFLLPPLHFIKTSRNQGSKPHSLCCSQAIGDTQSFSWRNSDALGLWEQRSYGIGTVWLSPIFTCLSKTSVCREDNTGCLLGGAHHYKSISWKKTKNVC